MNTCFRAMLSATGVLFGVMAAAPDTFAQSRGELLYSTHCVTCHSSKMHWRDQRAATDWASLEFQVRRWQATAGLAWNDADIQAVTRYLNETIYRYPHTYDPVTMLIR